MAYLLAIMILVAVGLLCFCLVAKVHAMGVFPVRALFRPVGKSRLESIVLVLCVCGLVHYGATKGLVGGASPVLRMGSAQLSAVPSEQVASDGLFPEYTNTVTNVCFTGICPAMTSVYLRASWPPDYALPESRLEIYAATSLTADAWMDVGVVAADIDENEVIVELPYSRFSDEGSLAGFFALGLVLDTDGDGLTDSFERLVSRTDPNSADTDGDGMPDGWEYCYGLNPRSDPTDGEANSDSDGDGLSNVEEFKSGTNPHDPDTDGDGLTDSEEVGHVEELRGEGFLWLDTTGHANALGNSTGIDSCRTKIPIPFGVEVNGVCHTNAQIDLDGLVTLINPEKQSSGVGTGYHRSGGVSNYLWSADHLTIAAYNEDLYAKPRSGDWQSAFTYGLVATNGTEYAVVEYRNVGQIDLRNDDPPPVMNFQVILPKDETNVIYVSYLSVPEAISSLNEIQTFGIQLPTTNCVPGRGIYANLPWAKYDHCFDGPLTLKYHLPTGTLPNEADWDGDGLADADEIFVFHTDPFGGDTDGDGLGDGMELSYGTNPVLSDTDGDGMPDGWEKGNGLNPLSDDAECDSDEDGLPNEWEYYNGTNPQIADTDGDSLDDSEESVWFDYAGIEVPWLALEPVQSFSPAQNVDSQLLFCELPFPCCLAGRQFTVVAADVNGVVCFAEPSTTNSVRASNSGADLSKSQNKPYATVAAYWTDLYMRPALNSSVTFGVGFVGTNRYFAVQYEHIGFRSGTSNEISFQVSVCESEPGVVYVRYGTVVDVRGGSYTVSMGCQGVKEQGLDIRPRLSYYFRNPPPDNLSGTALAYHFGSGGSPLLFDSDGDGLDDDEENACGSNPRLVDTDGDGFSDHEESDYGMDPCSAVGVDGAEGDLDGDGLSNRDEHTIGTDPSLADTDGDGLSDAEETGVATVEQNREWADLGDCDGTDITGLFANPDSSVVSYPLRNDMRVQGACVTNVIIDLNGVLYFPRCGRGSDIGSSGGRSLDYSVCPDALVVAPYWRDLYVTTNAPATRISVFETGNGTNGLFVLQYENACLYSNRSRTSVTNAISFQVVVERGGLGTVRIVYKNVIGTGMTGQSANIGFQSLGGLWSHKFLRAQSLTAAYGSAGPTVLNVYGQLADGFGFDFLPGLDTNPLVVDTDGDGIPDGQEVASGTEPMAPDSDGDGMFDGWEQMHGLDPADPTGNNGADGDPDKDGVLNCEEYENNTDPNNSDSDGDGIVDGVEIEMGTNPTDRADAVPVQWVTVDGDLKEGVPKSEMTTLTIPAGRTCLVCVFVASGEHPRWTDSASEYNDVLYWDIHVTEGANQPQLSKIVRVNNEDGAWDRAQELGHSALDYFPVVLKDTAFFSAGDTDMSVSVLIRAENIADDELPSSVIVGLFPLNVVQSNMPTAMGAVGTTDAGTAYVREIVPTNGVAYITGQPAAPQLTAQFKGLPEWMDVRWSGSLATERNERGTRDNRAIQSKTVHGDEVYSITESLADEIVGGAVELQVSVAGSENLRYPFKIRGKNPLDATAREYIDANVDAEFRDFAWMIAKHESKSGSRVYNQFNPAGVMKELPNKTGGANRWGWGMCQIDRKENPGCTTAEVYDWHESVAAMNAILREKRGDAIRFLGYYSSAYSNLPNWIEPPSTNINGQVVSAEMWSTITLYNGAEGIPGQRTPTHQRAFSSPLCFDPQTGRWIFYQNTTNPNYVRDVMNGSTELEVE